MVFASIRTYKMQTNKAKQKSFCFQHQSIREGIQVKMNNDREISNEYMIQTLCFHLNKFEC